MRTHPAESIRLEGKSVVVTGAGRGIGAAYAEHLATLGAAVVVNDVDRPEAEATVARIRDAGGQALAHPGTVSDWQTAAELIHACVGRFGRIDGLVNNAGVFHAATAEQETEEGVRRMVEVNVLGTMFCGIHALRQMLSQGGGSLVNITSGSQSGAAGLGIYGATKGAVASLTYSWALDTAGTGVRVNALSPNAQTRMARVYEAWRGTVGVGQNDGKDAANNAPAVAFLLSDAARDIHGQVLRVDGPDLTLMTHPRLVAPVARRDVWTIDDVAEAFHGQLRAHLQPVGLAHDLGTDQVTRSRPGE